MAGVEELDDSARRACSARIRRLTERAVPVIVEEIKWRKPSNPSGVPVWSANDGIVLSGGTYKDKVKLTFFKGASLEDPAGLFNSSLEGNDEARDRSPRGRRHRRGRLRGPRPRRG